jgi:hypothetical protein
MMNAPTRGQQRNRLWVVPIPDWLRLRVLRTAILTETIDIQMVDKRHNYAAAKGTLASNDNRRLKIIEARRAGA